MKRFALPTLQTRRLRQASALIAASRLPEAESLLADAVQRWPKNFDLRLQHAFCAHNAGRYAEALERWNALRADWPDCAMAWSGSAANTRELGRYQDAEAIIAEAHRRFPSDLIALSEGVRIYDRLADPARSLDLLLEMVRLDPHQVDWRRQCCDRLLGAGRFEEAGRVTAEMPEAADELAFCRARIALLSREWDTANHFLHVYLRSSEPNPDRVAEVRRVAQITKLHEPQTSCFLYGHLLRASPSDPSLSHHRVDALIRCGRCEEAEVEARAALEAHPGHGDLLFDLAHVALKTERWHEAVLGFEDLVRRRPSNLEAKSFLARALMERAQAELEGRATNAAFVAERQDVGLVEDSEARELLLGFESLGQDCEFGLVQRHFGAEPLSLFRWTFTVADLLVAALDARLVGMGEPEHTGISLWADYEYKVFDTRWGFAMHTWITRHEAERDDVYRKMCRRFVFLREKLLSDLATGEKIFVFKTFDTGPAEVSRLFASLRQFGPACLLWVRSLAMDPQLAQHKRNGEVEEIEPGLYAGYLDQFGNQPSGPWRIAFGDWVDLCLNARSLRSRSLPLEHGHLAAKSG